MKNNKFSVCTYFFHEKNINYDNLSNARIFFDGSEEYNRLRLYVWVIMLNR